MISYPSSRKIRAFPAFQVVALCCVVKIVPVCSVGVCSAFKISDVYVQARCDMCATESCSFVVSHVVFGWVI